MTTKDMDLECYWANLEASDKANYARLFPAYIPSDEGLVEMWSNLTTEQKNQYCKDANAWDLRKRAILKKLSLLPDHLFTNQ